MWLTFALIGYTCLAVVSILDKFILSEEKVKPVVFAFYSTVFLFPFVLGFPFTSQRPDLFGVAVIGIAAAGFVVSLITMYKAFQRTEVSHCMPFIGGLTPLFVLMLSTIFLDERLMGDDLAGIVLLSVGTLLISVQKNMRREWGMGMVYAALSAASFSIFHVCTKFTYGSIGFTNGFIFIWGTMGIIGVFLFLNKSVREAVFPRKNFITMLAAKLHHHKTGNRQAAIIIFDKILAAGGVFIIQYAVSLGSVAKVNALSGAQYALLVLLVALLSNFAPKIFKESYDHGELRRELTAVFIIAVGLSLLVT
jgi:uncharacterized membrane protein